MLTERPALVPATRRSGNPRRSTVLTSRRPTKSDGPYQSAGSGFETLAANRHEHRSPQVEAAGRVTGVLQGRVNELVQRGPPGLGKPVVRPLRTRQNVRVKRFQSRDRKGRSRDMAVEVTRLCVLRSLCLARLLEEISA